MNVSLFIVFLLVASASASPQRLRDRIGANRRRPNNDPGLSPPSSVGGQGNVVVVDNNNEDGPLFPSFTATRAQAPTQNGPRQIRFEHSITNEGAGFSTGRGEFTAPVSGTYSFSWSAVSPPGRAARISLAKNDREIDVHSWAEENGYQAMSNSAVLVLRKGDRVSLRLTEGRVYEPNGTNSGYTTFTGFRIH